MNCVRVVLIICLLAINYSEQYNILVVFPHFGKSHFLVYKSLFEKLSDIGHNLTVISYFPRKEKLANYRDVDLNDGSNLPEESLSVEDMMQYSKYQGANQLAEFAAISCPKGLSSKNFQEFLKEDNYFDLLLIEIFNSNCFFGLAKKFNTPIIGLSTSYFTPWMHDFFGFPDQPSYMPNLFLDFSDKMNFLNRVENTLAHVYSNLVFKYLLASAGYDHSKKYTGIDMRDGVDPLYNMSLMLINIHHSFIRPRPLTTNIIQVGGIHIAPAKKLPQDIEKFINDSKNGVIYMSMGSMLKGHTFPKERLQSFLRAFGKLQQRVIWKWENETIEGNPGNVMTVRWAPQRDIICHPNVKVFISHGGLLGSLEAANCGIPVIIMPQYGDQFSNAKALEGAGIGIILELKSVTEQNILAALSRALSPEFRSQAQDVSDRFRDRPLPPMDTAIYWIEYIARHKGARFLRSTAVDLPFYQIYLLDVVAFLLFVSITAIFVLFFVTKKILNLLFASNAPNIKQKRS